MNDNEKIAAFSDMVNAAERLSKPWRLALIITNLLWAIALVTFMLLAYLSPVEMDQDQNLPGGTQNQSYSEGATHGD